MAFHWLKVHAGLPDHPKTLALAAELGIDLAEAYPVRLWGWCLVNAPSGRIPARHAITAVESACRWRGERGALFNALLSVGFLDSEGDEVVVHEWEQEQRPAVEKAERDAQRKRERRSNGAQTARAETAPTAPTAPAACLSVVSSISSEEIGVQGEEIPPPRIETPPKRRAEDLQSLWNDGRPASLAAWKGMSKARRAKAVLRLNERRFEEWQEVVSRIRASEFCLGGGAQGWRAHVDWLLEPASADKVLEGLYDERAKRGGAPPGEVAAGTFAQQTAHLQRDENGDLVL